MIAPGERREVLQALGLTDVHDRVYLLLMDRQPRTAAEVGEEVGISVTRARVVLRDLEDVALITRSATNRFTPTSPEHALESLVRQRQRDLDEVRQEFARIVDQYRRAVNDPLDLMEIVRGEAARARYMLMEQMATREFVGISCPPYPERLPPLNEAQIEAMSRGVRFRVIYHPAWLDVPGGVERLETYIAAGEQARVLRGVPSKLMIADETMAMIPLTLDVTTPGGSLFVKAGPLVNALVKLFDMLWDRAVPFGGTVGEASPRDAGPSAVERQILRLLAGGMKDESIARQLGITRRTVLRYISRLMDEVGVDTRFQLGIQVKARGWL